VKYLVPASRFKYRLFDSVVKRLRKDEACYFKF